MKSDSKKLERKKCSRCGETKSIIDFYSDKRAKDGLRSDCKRCMYNTIHLGKLENPQKYKDRDAKYRAKKGKEYSRANASRHQKRYRKKYTEKQRIWRAKHPEAYRAYKIVEWAIGTGKLQKPIACEQCGAKENRLEASHNDYSKPLIVEWLCVKCHRERDGNPLCVNAAKN